MKLCQKKPIYDILHTNATQNWNRAYAGKQYFDAKLVSFFLLKLISINLSFWLLNLQQAQTLHSI